MARPPGEAPIERDEVEDRDKYLGIMQRKRGGMAWGKDEDELDSEREQRIKKRKRGGRIKHSKVTGGPGRRRPDRRAVGGGTGFEKGPLKGDAPPSGEVEQRFKRQVGGAVEPKKRSYDTLKAAGGMAAGGHITTAQRKALPSSDFALPGKGKGAGGKGPGSYPIDTPNRARNALARGAQHASPGELATIKRKVHAKYPGIGES